MTRAAYVLMPFSQPVAVYLDLDTMLAHIRHQHPGATVELKEQTVKIKRGGTILRRYVSVTGLKEHVPGLGEFTGGRNIDYHAVPLVTP
ncbi:hypothetical protein [Deinococcus kurensis]|uniref:hypothetical protein n=1 Tax=Deinococcus kurensis TaxID=2662757 RepID=UPI0012D2A5CA|nr:hypothetical protein [Deinococcus kurensis]